MRFVPRKLFLTRGLGVHRAKLTSFELALRDAGIAHLNLVRVSSILPPGCRIVSRDEGLAALEAGEVTFAVIAEMATDEPGRRIAVLGDMLELGPFTAQGHEKVGVRAAEVVEVLVTVGSYSKITAQAAREAGLAPERIIACESAEQAAEAVQRLGGAPGYILIKGSRAMRMEAIVRRLAAQERPCP